MNTAMLYHGPSTDVSTNAFAGESGSTVPHHLNGHTDEASTSDDRTASSMRVQDPPAESVVMNDGSIKDVLIAIVDDQSTNIQVLEEYLKLDGYHRFLSTTDSKQAMTLVTAAKPDVLLLDIHMPDVDGNEILRQLRSMPEFATMPVLILTASEDSETRVRSIELGANDFLSKPIEPRELAARLNNTLTLKQSQDKLARYAGRLEELVDERTKMLEQAQQEAIHCLAKASECRDSETGNHVLRVGMYAGVIARGLGMDESQCAAIELAATLHDVGKIAIPDSILLKAGKLDPDEYELMKRHCGLGRNMCQTLDPQDIFSFRSHVDIGPNIIEAATSPIMKLAAKIAQTHHERWDGNGYPLGLKGTDIPIEGRITAVADVFDALSSKRPYKKAFPIEKSFEILTEESGKHFDPAVVDSFFEHHQTILQIQLDFMDN